jgi:hypothetical protein
MLLAERYEKSATGQRRRVFSLQCDQCGIKFEKFGSYGANKKPHHFCSRKCLDIAHSRDGILFTQITNSIVSKHGADFYQRILAKGQKKRNSSETRAKKRQTLLKRYGVEYACQIPHVRAAADVVRGSPESSIKRKATCMERYGVESVLSLTRVHALANTPNACHKRHCTMRDNGSYFNSQSEHAFYETLCNKFGIDDIQRQITINGWPIDFYIKSIDTYVQFDGVYWHGLDRPLTEIGEFKTPRDKTILRKFQIDREQEEWFKSTGKHLLRVTDKQYLCGELPDELKR